MAKAAISSSVADDERRRESEEWMESATEATSEPLLPHNNSASADNITNVPQPSSSADNDDEEEAQLLLTIHAELTNMGKALSCPICQCTLQDPVMNSCVHAFCRTCLEKYLSSSPLVKNKHSARNSIKKCPMGCGAPCGRRTYSRSAHLVELVRAYKLTLRAFAMTPIVHGANIDMTQLPDDDDDVKKKAPTLMECHEHKQLAETLLHAQKKKAASLVEAGENSHGNNNNDDASRQLKSLQTLIKIQENVVEVDKKALVRAAVEKHRTSLGRNGKDGVHIGTTNVSVESRDLCPSNYTRTVQAGVTNSAEPSHPSDEITVNHNNDHPNTRSNGENVNDISDITMETVTSEPTTTTDITAKEDDVREEFFTAEESEMLIQGGKKESVVNDHSHSQEVYEMSMDAAREKEAADRSGELMLEEEEEKEKAANKKEEAGGDVFELSSEIVSEGKTTETMNDVQDKCFDASSDTRERSDHDDCLSINVSNNKGTTSSSVLAVGTIVQVQDRTWPGVNKPGGVARITKIHNDIHLGTPQYDVAFVLGGREKKVDSSFVAVHEEACFMSPKKRNQDADDGRMMFDRKLRNGKENDTPPTKTRQQKVGNTTNDSSKRSSPKNAITTTTITTPFTNKRRKTTNDADDAENNTASLPADSKGSEFVVTCEEDNQSVAPPISTTTTTTAEGTTNERKQSVVADSFMKNSFGAGMSNSEMDRLAMQRYTALFLPLAADSTRKQQQQHHNNMIHIVTSSLNESNQTLVHLLCREFQGTVKEMKGMDPKCNRTVCITAPNPGKANVSKFRTLKAMRAMLAGLPILTPLWVSACLREKKIVSPSSLNDDDKLVIRSVPTKEWHLVDGENDGTAARRPFDRNGVIAFAAIYQKHQNEGLLPPVLFRDTVVLLCGPWKNGPGSKKDAMLLFKEAGAEILSSPTATIETLESSSDTTNIVLVCDDSSTDKGSGITNALWKTVLSAKALGKKVHVVNCHWLFDCISCATMLDSTHHKPSSPRAASLWKTCIGTEK